MSPVREIEWAAAILFAGVGLVQIYAPGLFTAYHARLIERGPAAVRGYGLVVLSLGGLIAVFHNVWSGPALVLTAAGWLLVLEGAVCAFAPSLGSMGFAASDPAMRRRAVVATGVGAVIVSGVLWADLLIGAPGTAG